MEEKEALKLGTLAFFLEAWENLEGMNLDGILGIQENERVQVNLRIES